MGRGNNEITGGKGVKRGNGWWRVGEIKQGNGAVGEGVRGNGW